MKNILSFGMMSFLLVGCDNQQSQTDIEDDVSDQTEERSLGTTMIMFNIDDRLYDIEESELNQKIDWTEEVTLLEVMQSRFDTVDSDGFINSIEGYEQDDSKGAYWLYDINGESAMVGAGDYVLEDGDEILWNLEMSQNDE